MSIPLPIKKNVHGNTIADTTANVLGSINTAKYDGMPLKMARKPLEVSL